MAMKIKASYHGLYFGAVFDPTHLAPNFTMGHPIQRRGHVLRQPFFISSDSDLSRVQMQPTKTWVVLGIVNPARPVVMVSTNRVQRCYCVSSPPNVDGCRPVIFIYKSRASPLFLLSNAFIDFHVFSFG